jgi:YVTN family beta-propeller protein
MSAFQGGRSRLQPGVVWLSFGLMVFSLAAASSVGVAASVSDRSALPGPVPGSVPAVPDGTPPDPPPLLPAVVATVPVGSEPLAGAVDLANGWAYVANTVGNSVSVLNGTSVVATVSLTPTEVGSLVYVVYDSSNAYVYVVDEYNFETAAGAVTILDGTTIVATVSVGSQPVAAVFDPSNGYVYVADAGAATVTVLDGTSAIATVAVGTSPSALAYDPADGYVYVANDGSGNVTVLSGVSVVGGIGTGAGPLSAAYDPADHDVYVANNVSGNVSVLSGLSVVGSVAVGNDPTFLAFNTGLGDVEVTNTGSNNLTALNGTAAVAWVAVASAPVWVGLGPTGAFTFVVGSASNSVTVLEGLSVVETLGVGGFPLYAVVDVPTGLVYVLDSGASEVSVIASTYAVSFDESGLGAGVAWSVTLGLSTNSTTSTSIGFVEPAGVYAYTIATPTGYVLVSSAPASPLTVTDASLVVQVTFAPVSSATYTLTFVESGLVSTCPSHHGGGHVSADGAQGGSHCCRGSSTLPAWSVTVDGLTKTTNTTSITFTEPNGTYVYTIGAPSGYTVKSSVPASPVTIAGSDVTVEVTFTKCAEAQLFTITFDEQGLPTGTTWCVTVNTTECSSGAQIVFSDVAPGSYGFNVSAVAGYTAQPAAGTVTVSHQSVTVTIRFSTTTHRCGG